MLYFQLQWNILPCEIIFTVDFESCKPRNVLTCILIFCIIHIQIIVGGAKRMLAIKKGTYPD